MVVGITKNQLRGHYCYITLHIASCVPQSYIFQLGGSGNIYEVFISTQTGQ